MKTILKVMNCEYTDPELSVFCPEHERMVRLIDSTMKTARKLLLFELIDRYESKERAGSVGLVGRWRTLRN